jgi:hypothetical protein
MRYFLTGMAVVSALGFQYPAISAQAASTGSATPAASCPAHWTATNPGLQGSISSVAALSPSDIWAITLPQTIVGDAYVYHFNGSTWQTSLTIPTESGKGSIVASSDSNVWVVGPNNGNPAEVWHYNGSSWASQVVNPSADAELEGAALGSDGALYVVGENYATNSGLVWSYNGAKWTDLTPSPASSNYDAVTISEGATLIVGGSQGLQELSGGSWATVSMSSPGSISGIAIGPGGTIYAVGSGAAGNPILVEQQPGATAAAVLTAPAPSGRTVTATGITAISPDDVWMFGLYGKGSLPTHYWIVNFNGQDFTVAATPKLEGYNFGGPPEIAGGYSLGSAVYAYGNGNIGGDSVSELLAVCPVQVNDASVTPDTERIREGTQTWWSVPASDTTNHDLISPGLFNSGAIKPGSSFAYTFFAAAAYTVRDSDTSASSTVRVVPTVTPATGTSGTVFTVTAASIQAPLGFKYRILIKRPGAKKYSVLTQTTQPAVNFIPSSGTGTYSFECELRTRSGVTGASPAVAVTVS